MTASRMLYRFCSALGAALFVALLVLPGRAAQDPSQTRAVSGFDRVATQGAFSTVITVGTHDSRVVVTASSDMLDNVTTTVDHGTLMVGMKQGNWNSWHPIHVSIVMPVLRGFREEGAGKTSITGIAGGDLDIATAGAGSIRAAGRANRLTIALEGAGSIDTTALDARDVTVNNDGVGSVRVRASTSLSATVNGVGKILYTGSVSHVTSAVNGVGFIHRF